MIKNNSRVRNASSTPYLNNDIHKEKYLANEKSKQYLFVSLTSIK